MDRTKRTLYLDLDDVVADWMGAAQRFLNITWVRGGPLIPMEDWNRLKQQERFYRDLPLMDGAIELVQWAEEFTAANNMNLAFLTAIPHDNDVPWVFQDKLHWVADHFPNIPVFFGPYAKDKQRHCRPGDILFDDRPENCAEWEARGGIAHCYTTWNNCQEWIESELAEVA